METTGLEVVLSVVLTSLHLLVSALCVVHIMRSRKRAAATVLWTLVVIQLPWLGPLLYVVFGINRVRRRIELRQSKQARLRPRIRELRATSSRERAEAGHAFFKGSCPEPLEELFELLDNVTGVGAVEGNRCTLMRGGERVFAEMTAEIDRAERSVHLMTYILDFDEVGREMLERLERRAATGVEVRVLVDGYGSTTFPLRFLRRRPGPNMQVKIQRQLQPLRGRVSVNLRNHRKLLICDGRVAFTGGMNVSARHLLEGGRRRPHLDHHTRIEGPAVAQLQRVFAEDWFDATSESVLAPLHFPKVAEVGSDLVRTISSGPDKDEPVMLEVFCAAIHAAGRSVQIVTPYFVPDPAVVMALKLAALGGVETTIVVPGLNNHPWIKYASRYRYPELLKAGVRIYEREPPFSHSKLFLVDDAWACVGSANWDMRSFHLQFDTNVGVVSTEFVAAVRAAVDDEVAHSVAVEAETFLPRPVGKSVLERAANLFEDLM